MSNGSAGHTAGPLVALRGKQVDGYYHVRRDYGGRMTAGYFFTQGDAVLFASAPDLVAALEAAYALINHDEGDPKAVRSKVRAAMNKARGE